jgi:type II secretion system protein N
MPKFGVIALDSEAPLSLTTTQAKKSKSRQTIGLVALFFCSLIFFIYVSFPYSVVKEWISATAMKETGIRFRMDDLSPNLPLGISASGIELEGKPGQPPVKIKSIDLSIGLFSLLMGKLAVDLEVAGDKSGELDLGVRLSLFKGLIDGVWIPSVIELNSRKFAIGPLVAYGLGMAADNQAGSNPIVKELLENIMLVGDLDGIIDFDINVGDPIQSRGQAELQLKGARLSFVNPSLNISPQSFEIATIKADVKDGKMLVDRASRFKSEGLDFGLSGTIALMDNLEKSTVEIGLSLKLDQDLKQNYGFLLGAEGELNGSLRGTLSQIQFAKQ